MTQPPPDENTTQPVGFQPPTAPPYPGHNPQPYQGQQQGYPAAPPAQQYPQAQGYPPAPQPQQYLTPQYQGQPPMPNQAYGYPQQKSKIAAGLFGIFLGGLGIHRFYLGYTAVGVIQLVLTVLVSVFTLGLGLFFVGLWGFIEGIMILSGAAHFQKDARGVPLRD